MILKNEIRQRKSKYNLRRVKYINYCEESVKSNRQTNSRYNLREINRVNYNESFDINGLIKKKYKIRIENKCKQILKNEEYFQDICLEENDTIFGTNIKRNISQTVSNHINKTRKRKRDDDDDLDYNSFKENNEEKDFNWDDFNVYQSANDIEEKMENEKKEWVSATSIKNYMMKEPLIDWFDLYYLDYGFNENNNDNTNNNTNDNTNDNNKNNYNDNYKNNEKNKLNCEKNKLNIFFQMGNKFEDEVIKYFRNFYPNCIKKVVSNYKELNQTMNLKTYEYMKEGIPIIEQAALYNFKNKTFGVADLLIRSDWLNKLFQQQIIPNDEEYIKAVNLNDNYHYRVIDIKWTTMHLCSNGKTIRNSQRFPAYKGQLAIYNAALGLLQGYTPNEAYILSKSWNINNGKKEGFNCFTLLGSIVYDGFDSKYIKETYDAVRWIRNVRYNGYKWKCINPSVPELYPNMCNRYDSPYHYLKQDLSDKIKELTQIWMVGVKHRKIAHSNGVYRWDDPRCNSEIMGLRGKKIGPIVDKIIEINRYDDVLLKPIKIKNNINNWQHKNELDFYIDFEIINGCLFNTEINLKNSRTDNQIVFLIGLGYEENGLWYYKSFLTKKIDLDEEKKIIYEFINFIELVVQNYKQKYGIVNKNNLRPRMFHWSHAEKSIFNILNKRHNNEWSKWLNSIEWIDMCKVFIDEPIVINGAKKFNLKEIAKTMANHGMIQSKWDNNGPSNGLNAMLEAIEYYKYIRDSNNNENRDKYVEMINSIVNYNEIDCKVVWEIVTYLRREHSNKI